MGFIDGNESVLILSISLLILFGVAKLMKGQILVLLMILIVLFDIYYFVGMTKSEQMNIKIQADKALDSSGEYVKKIEPMALFSDELRLKLKSNDIKTFDDIKKFLDEKVQLNEWKLRKIEDKEAKKAMKQIR